MFKKIIAGLVVCFCLTTGLAFAQPAEETVEPVVVETTRTLELSDLIEKIPVLKQGVVFSIDDLEFKYISTIELLERWGFTIEGGYASPDAIIAVLSYRLGGLKDLGVNVPVLDLLECNVGYYVGIQDIGHLSDQVDFDHGVSATLLNIKF